MMTNPGSRFRTLRITMPDGPMHHPFRRALTLLNHTERRNIYLLLVLSALAAIVQMVAILSIMPFIVLLSNPAIVESNAVLSRVYLLLGVSSFNEFLTYSGIFAVLFLLIGNAFLAVEHRASSRFLCLLVHRLEKRTLECMLQQPYEYFLANNSGRLSDIVLNQVERVVDGVIGRFIVVFSNAVLATCIVIMLLVVSLQTTLITLAGLLVLYLGIFIFLRGRIARHGRELTDLSGDVFTTVRDTLEGIREIKTRQVEQHFVDRFSQPSLKMSRLAMRYSMLSFMPHFILETFVFAGLVMVALYFIVATQSPGLTLSLIALYGLAAYRLVPSMKSAFEGMSDMHHNEDAVRVVLEHSRTTKPAVVARELPEPRERIKVERVAYSFASPDEPSLSEIELSIPIGSSVCLFGPSGSGKSTLLNIIAGLLRPQAGGVSCDGTAITDETVASWRRRLGYCPQRIFLFDDTLASNVAFGVPAEEVDVGRLTEVAGIVRLDEFVRANLNGRFDAVIGEGGKTVSGGQAQRIGLARVLYHDPSILLLDESFNGLDVATRDAILDNLFSLENKTLIFASHELGIANRCDAVVELSPYRAVPGRST